MKRPLTKEQQEKAIIDFLQHHPSRSYSAKELAKKLKVKKRNFKPFRRLLLKLTSQNRITQSSAGVFQWSTAVKAMRAARKGRPRRNAKIEKEQLEGTLQQYRGGFAFVIPKESDHDDIFIPPGSMAGALSGDRVLVRVFQLVAARKREGQVIKILERKTTHIVGTFETGASYGRILPFDRKLNVIPVVSTKNFHGATDGMMVEAEIISDASPPEARVVALLGFRGEPELDAKIIISKYRLSRDFDPDVLSEAEQVAQIRDDDLKGRKDFRQWNTVTIDGEKARDFDDGISVTAFKNGSFLLGVHIADVAHYVREGSALDREALERGNSVYFPDLVIPMLPEKLSNDVCSLNPQVDRLTMSVVMRINANGKLQDYHIYPGVIHSNERMTYTAVKQIVADHEPELLRRYEPLVDMFLTMKKLALLLMRSRRKKGSIDFDLPEPEVIIDLTTGKMTGIVKAERNIAHRMIEEFMLITNEVVATHLLKSKLPGIYRVHENPPPEKIGDFAAIAASLGYRLPQDPERIKPKDLQKLLKKIQGKPEEKFLNVLLLRSLAKARYDENNRGHYGLSLDSYTHFTSPIRRYPDLLVHRILKALISRKQVELRKVKKMGERIPEMAEHCSGTERKADDAEREFIQLKKVEFMKTKLGEVYGGYISGVASYGLFVELNDFFVEGLVPLRYMDDDHYVYHEKKHFYKGRRKGKILRLGDAVQVQVIRVDRDRREIDFLLVED